MKPKELTDTLSAIIFVLPGLVIVGWWTGFPFWESFLICLSGGAPTLSKLGHTGIESLHARCADPCRRELRLTRESNP